MNIFLTFHQLFFEHYNVQRAYFHVCFAHENVEKNPLLLPWLRKQPKKQNLVPPPEAHVLMQDLVSRLVEKQKI